MSLRHQAKTVLVRFDRLLSSIRYGILGNLLFWISGCYYIPKARGPLKTSALRWNESTRQDRLLVFLPGTRDRASDFVDRGLWKRTQEAGLVCDAVAVEAHLGYYLKQSIVARLEEDVLRPARQTGYREIWVVGNSLGGLGALLAQSELSEAWDCIFLLAPFLGDDKRLYRAFAKRGGVQNWKPEVEFAKTDFSPRLWQWLQRWPDKRAKRPPTYLGYGTSDKLKLGIDHLAPLLPAEHVARIDGGHTWSAWEPLFETLVKKAVAAQATRPPN